MKGVSSVTVVVLALFAGCQQEAADSPSTASGISQIRRLPVGNDQGETRMLNSPLQRALARGMQRDYLFQALSDPLPQDFLAIAFLDSVNGVAIDGKLQQHPFDSTAGKQRLQVRLEDRMCEDPKYEGGGSRWEG